MRQHGVGNMAEEEIDIVLHGKRVIILWRKGVGEVLSIELEQFEEVPC